MEQKIATNFAVNREKLEISMSRVFDAPRELVYKICTDPKLVGQWWGPEYLTTQVERYDVQEGGGWRFVQQDPDGTIYGFQGVFREVRPPERLMYTFIFDGTPEHEVIETITFEDLDGKTRVTTVDSFTTLEALDVMVSSGMENGAVESMDRLAKLVEGKRSNTVTSKDGTSIAYERNGAGPVLIVVDGALGFRGMIPGEDPYAAMLAEHFTVYAYDRRGRGESSDKIQETGAPLSVAVEREIEDLEAVIDAAGGSAYLYGVSSGGALVLEAAVRLAGKVKKIAMYEVPFNDDPEYRGAWRGYVEQLGQMVAEGRRGDAVGLFMMLVGASAEDVEGMRGSPIWAAFESVASTLPYDHIALLGEDARVPVELAAQIKVPALLMDGGASFPFMHDTAVKLAKAIPNGRQRTLEGQTHEVAPDVIVPELVAFFKAV